MPDQLELLKSENQHAENDFQSAVKNYLLNPLEDPDELNQALMQLFESVTRYRFVLRRLREYLNSLRESESSLSRQTKIETAIVKVNTKDAALERLLRKVAKIMAEQSARSMPAPASR